MRMWVFELSAVVEMPVLAIVDCDDVCDGGDGDDAYGSVL